MFFPHASGSPEEAILKRIATLHKELRYEERHTARYSRLTAAIRELSAAYCTAVDARRARPRDASSNDRQTAHVSR
jgi:hypothetical protein